MIKYLFFFTRSKNFNCSFSFNGLIEYKTQQKQQQQQKRDRIIEIIYFFAE